MLRPFLHLRESNAVLDWLPINGDRELGRRTRCHLYWASGAKFCDCMSDSFIQRVRVNLNGVQNSIGFGERDATAGHTGIIALCSSFLRSVVDVLFGQAAG